MDLQGSLADTNVRIYPSKKLLTFLDKQDFTDTVPITIGKLVLRDDYKPKGKVVEPKQTDININSNDIKLLNKISSLMNDKHSNESNENKENTDPDVENKTKDSEEGEKSKIKDLGKEPVNNKGSKHKINVSKQNNTKKEEDKNQELYLTTPDIEWLYIYLKERRKKDTGIPYLHELLESSQIKVPPNQIIKRNPDLEARCVKLRAQQEAREYRKMTKGVDNVRMRFPEDSISYQLKQMNRQMIAIGQFIISIFAGFLFGFKGVEWMIGSLDFGFRLLLGVMCALLIALAEIYFLAKKLNEELNVPETTQLGGPPKFTDEKLYQNVVKKSTNKPHQD